MRSAVNMGGAIRMLGGLLPDAARCREEFGDGADHRRPGQQRHAAVAANRRREFGAARECARRALAALGRPAATVPRGVDGAPCWPDGVVGSITHCAGYRAAAVAERTEIAALGIDAEPHRSLSARALDRIALPAEREMLDVLATGPGGGTVPWALLLFSAKESVYKAWYPLTGAWLGFHDVRVDIDVTRTRFTAHLPPPGITVDGRRVDLFHGRYTRTGTLLATAVAVPATEELG